MRDKSGALRGLRFLVQPAAQEPSGLAGAYLLRAAGERVGAPQWSGRGSMPRVSFLTGSVAERLGGKVAQPRMG